MHDDGVIKFNLKWIKAEPLQGEGLKDLIECRSFLHRLELIGEYDDGVGYGNLSARTPGSRQFVITGTQTGGLPILGPEHFTLVVSYDISKNVLECRGPVKASSEALTHAMIYEMNPSICGVIHVHHAGLWDRLKGRVPTSREDVPYGTPAMADEVSRLYREESLRDEKILVMAGHRDGVITFGSSLKEAADILMNFYRA